MRSSTMDDRIHITADYARSRVKYNIDTGVLEWRPKPPISRIDRMWNTRFAGSIITHKNSTGHIQFSVDGKNYLAHRIAWLIVHGFCPPLIDHKNGVRDDNRLINLRPATRSQNNSNTRAYSSNTHGFRGIWENGKRWSVQIGWRGQRIYGGTYGSKEEAARAYDSLAVKFHGEFATTNFLTIGGEH